MRVLICGHRSFAAKGLPALLRAAGHEVTCFSRGPIERREVSDCVTVTGPVDSVHANPHLQQPFDTIVNYIMLKDEPIAPNLVYIDSLLDLCRVQKIPHLVHVSSISSYRGDVKLVNEDAPLETIFEKKGPYGSIKAATEDRVTKNVPAGTKLTLLRPGFILGEGLLNPIVGTAVRYPSNKLLVIGNARSVIPMISREQVNESIKRIIETPPSVPVEGLLLASRNSPTRLAFLEACCKRMGAGMGVVRFAVPIWYAVAAGAEIAARVLGQGKLKPYSKIAARLPGQSFDPTKTEARLGMKFDLDWASALENSLDDQQKNFQFPYIPQPLSTFASARNVTFIGFGRIVKQKHLPALKRIGFNGTINAYDLRDTTDPNGQVVRAMADAKLAPADLFVLASPGPAHTAALPQLRETSGAVLVEKPLAYTREDVAHWADFAKSRKEPVLVCHNYRFKRNVAQMLSLMQKYNPGRLRHVHVHFESPPAGNDSVAWLRNERRARTLLMDYAIHFLDLACMFNTTSWRTDGIRFELNRAGETSLIEGRLVADNYSVSFMLRQSFSPRRARLLFNFQNYSTSLGFFPDTFVPYMSNDNSWLHKQEARQSRRETIRKVFDKAFNRDSDLSHAYAFSAALENSPSLSPCLRVESLKSFYDVLFDVGRIVYEGGAA